MEKIRSTPRIPLKETGFDDFEFKNCLTTYEKLNNYRTYPKYTPVLIYLLICGLFKDAVSNLDYVVSNCKIIND